MGRYFTAKLPHELADRLKAVIDDRPDLGFKSTNEAVKEAVRRYIDYLERFPKGTPTTPDDSPEAQRRREQFAHEMILIAERYLGNVDKEGRPVPKKR